MKVFKAKTTILLLALSPLGLMAQNQDALLGKWTCPYELEGEKGMITYEFKKDKGVLKAYSVLYAPDGESEYEDDELVLKDIKFSDGKGKASCILEDDGEVYELNAQLNLLSSDKLEVKFSAWGYSEKETWKKVR